MKILLLGGTGILSTDFTRKTLDEGNDVRILNRGRRITFADGRADLIIADLRKESIQELREKLRDLSFDVIVDYLSYDPSQLKKSLAVLEGKYTQYIFISSATAYIKEDGDIIREATHTTGTKDWDYAYGKSLCEKFIQDTDVNFTIIRPYVTYGESRIPFQLIPDGYHYTLISRIKNNKPVALPDGGSAICTLTHTEDFANILYKLLLNEKAYRQDFHITSPYCQSWKKVYEIICDILGCEYNSVSVSLDNIKRYMPEYYGSLKGDKGTSWRFDNSKVLDAIGGYDYKIDLTTGLGRSISFFEKHDFMQGIDYKWEGKIDYMISHVCGCKDLRALTSSNTQSSAKKYYYIFKTPMVNEICTARWRLKHRDHI